MTDLGLIETELGRVVVTAAMVDDVLSLVLLAVVRKSTTTFGDVAAGRRVGGRRRRRRGPRRAHAPGRSSKAGAAGRARRRGARPGRRRRLRRGQSRLDAAPGLLRRGVCFASVEGVARRFDDVVVPPASWLYRVFFASIGFVVPLGQARVRAGGALRAAPEPRGRAHEGGHGLFYREDPWKVGWAMVGRGELGFVMALETFHRGRTSRLALSVTVWALLVATLVSPVILRRLLARARRRRG